MVCHGTCHRVVWVGRWDKWVQNQAMVRGVGGLLRVAANKTARGWMTQGSRKFSQCANMRSMWCGNGQVWEEATASPPNARRWSSVLAMLSILCLLQCTTICTCGRGGWEVAWPLVCSRPSPSFRVWWIVGFLFKKKKVPICQKAKSSDQSYSPNPKWPKKKPSKRPEERPT